MAAQWVRSCWEAAGAARGLVERLAAGRGLGAGRDAGRDFLAGLAVRFAAFLAFLVLAAGMGDPVIESELPLKKGGEPRRGVPGRAFEEFTPGQVIEHQERL